MSTVRSHEVAALLGRCYETVSAAVADASDTDLKQPSGCAGWSAAELLVHLMADARRALITLATPEPGPADTDDVSYWIRGMQPAAPADPSSASYTKHVRALAAAYPRPSSILLEWQETAPAAVRAALAADPGQHVGTQGCVMTTANFIATLVFESTIHQLDFAVALPGAQPSDDALALTARTLAAMVDGGLPEKWSDSELILKVSGRKGLTEADLAQRQGVAATLPLVF